MQQMGRSLVQGHRMVSKLRQAQRRSKPVHCMRRSGTELAGPKGCTRRQLLDWTRRQMTRCAPGLRAPVQSRTGPDAATRARL